MRVIFSSLILCLLPGGSAEAAEHGVILLYHHVAGDSPPSTTISPEDFRGHLQYLRDNDFNVIGLDRLVESLRNRQPLPERAVVITFDDGYQSIYTNAFPMLREFAYPFTLFVSTGPIDRNQSGYMNWAQIRELSDAGVIIANHMVEHPYMLDRGDTETDRQWIARLREELLAAETGIERETGQSHRYLAYPYGEYDPAVKAMLAAEGFVGLAQNSGAVGYNSDLLALPRYPLAGIYANPDTARTKFATRAFNVTLLAPASPVTGIRNPTARLRFDPGDYNLSRIGCFAGGEAIPMNWVDQERGVVELLPEQEYAGRRWRYICTAPDTRSGSYYWYSIQWIHPQD